MLEQSQGTWDIAGCKLVFEVWMEPVNELLPLRGVKDPSRAPALHGPSWVQSCDCGAASPLLLFARQTGQKHPRETSQELCSEHIPTCCLHTEPGSLDLLLA